MNRVEKLNSFKAYNMRLYLAHSPERLGLESFSLIDMNTSLINRPDFYKFIDHLTQKYKKQIDKNLIKLLGSKSISNYFDAYNFIVDNKVNVDLTKFEYLKKNGYRELYYAIKNYKENFHYNEGLFFSNLNDLNQSIFTIETMLERTQHRIKLSIDRAFENEVNTYITHISTHNQNSNFTVQDIRNRCCKINPLLDSELYIVGKDFRNKDEKILYKNTQSIFKKQYSNHNKLTLGSRKPSGLFRRKEYLTIPEASHVFFAGLHCGVSESMYGMLCENFINNKGILFFEFLTVNSYNRIHQIVKYFDREEDLLCYNLNDIDYNTIDLKNLMKNNKIVFFYYVNLDRNPHSIIEDTINNIDNLLKTIDTSDNHPYSVIFNQLPYELMNIDDTKKITDISNHLVNCGFGCLSFHSLYNYLKEDVLNYLLNNIEHLCLMKQEDVAEAKKFLDLSLAKNPRVNKLNPGEFYHFKNRKLNSSQHYKVIFPYFLNTSSPRHIDYS